MDGKNIQKTINFSDPRDSRTGFLSDGSKYSFILDEKRWPTVEHYIQAKKFEGTQYVEEIRGAPTVYQATRLAKPREILFINDSGKISKKIAYGKNGEYNIRKDWGKCHSSILKEAISAKFTQNKRLTKRLLDTRDAHLVDEKNPMTGIILEKVRSELRKNKSESSSISSRYNDSYNSTHIKDFKSPSMSSQEKQFVIGVITISKRISEMEGWDKIFKEMIEDVTYILTSDKEEIKNILNYINSFYKIPWTKIYHDLPNTYEIIHEIQEIFDGVDNSQGSQYFTVAAILRWFSLESTPVQKKNMFKRIKRSSTIHISIPKVQRMYRQRQPPFPKPNKIVKKEPRKKKNERQEKMESLPPEGEKPPEDEERSEGEERSEEIIESPKNIHSSILTPLEKKKIDRILEKQDCKGSLCETNVKQVKKFVRKKMRDFPTINKKDLDKYVEETYKEFLPKKSESLQQEDISSDTNEEKSPIPELINNTDSKKESVKDEYIPLEHKKEMTSMQEVVNPHDSSQKDHSDPLVIEEDPSEDYFFVKGKLIEKYMSKLVSLEGKIVKTEGVQKMKFGNWSRDYVINTIFESLQDSQKYYVEYKKWIECKLIEFIDTSIQSCYLLNKTIITENIIKVVMEHIYGYSLDKFDSSFSGIDFDYSKSIRNIFSQRKEYGSYKLTSEATNLLICRTENLGKSLIHPMGKTFTYKSFKKQIQEFEEQIDIAGNYPSIGNFTPYEIYIIRALRHISACFKNLFLYPLGMELCIRTFLTLVPSAWRQGAEQYMSNILQGFDEKITDPQEILEKNDIRYSTEDIFRVIQYYDTEIEEDRDRSGKLLQFKENKVCQDCMIIFSAALNYLTPSLSRPGNTGVLRRIKILGEKIFSDTIPSIENVSFSSESILLDESAASKVIENKEFNLTTFDKCDIITVLVDSKSINLSKADLVSASVFKTYPYSNIYIRNRSQEEMGTAILKVPIDSKTKVLISSTLDHRIVACLICNFSSGEPKEVIDTKGNRKNWFTSSVTQLFSLPEVKGRNIAFSSNQLSPEGYIEIIKEIVNTSSFSGDVYILDGKISSRVPSEKAKSAISRPFKPLTPPIKVDLYEKEDTVIKLNDKKEETQVEECEECEGGIPREIEKASLYLRIFGPLKLSSKNYSLLVEKLSKLPEKERNFFITRWKEISVSERKAGVKSFLSL